MNAQAIIDNGHIIMSHFARADRMINRIRAGANIGAQHMLVIAIAIIIRLTLERAESGRTHNFLPKFDAFE